MNSRLRELLTTRAFTGLRALALMGSRARSDAHAGSDWDFAVLADDDFDRLDLMGRLIDALRTNELDLVRLDTADGVLRFQAARDGVLIWEREPGEWIRFVERATAFWLDAGPAILEGGEALLRSLGEAPR